MPRIVRECAVPLCTSTSATGILHNFPNSKKKGALFNAWLSAVGNKDLLNKNPEFVGRNFFVCRVHFAPQDLYPTKLVHNAVPTLHLPVEKLDIATHLDSSSTCIDLQPPDTVQLGAEISISNDLLNDPLDTSSNIIQIPAANITAPTSHTTKNYPTDGMKEESTVEEGEVQITTSFTEPSDQFLLLQDIAETCRVCLCGGAEVDLHKTQYEGLTYFEMLEEVVGAKLKERHSVLICKGCEDGMIKAYIFKRQWEKSERVLDMWQVQNDKSTNEGHLDKANIDKTQESVSLQENPKLITKFYMYQGKINHNIDFGKLVEINKKRAITMTQGKTKYSRVFISPTGTMTRLSANDNRNIIRRAYQLGRKGQRRKLKATKKVTYPMACKICSENLNTENDYKDHVKETKHFHTPFPCDHCNRIFPSERTLKSHKARLLQRELCDRCGASFNTTSGLQYHVKMMHSGREKHKCSTCGKSHVDFKQLIRHRRLVHPRIQQPKTEVCELCGVKLSCRASLYAHKNQVHFNIRPVRCIICDARFSCRSLLKRHEAVHNLETFECGFCNIVFKHEDKFNSHRRRRHTALPIGANAITEYAPSSCEFCDLVCPNKQALSVHLKQHNIIVCIYCDDDTFEDAEELIDHHVKLHEALCEYMCRYCDKLYDGAESLYAHLSIHKCRTFKCDKCPKMYDSSSKLKRHKMYHEGVMKFNCRFCPRKFMYSTSVAIHERIHTGERPYKCDVCGSSHICASSRHKHRQTHFVKNSLNAEISGL